MRKVHRPNSPQSIDDTAALTRPAHDRAQLRGGRAACRAGKGPCALAPPSKNPPFSRRRFLSLVVRSVVITSMSFAAAFGFLSGATSPGAHYDPHTFAIGVSALFGAACGAIGILMSRIRQMKRELRDLETRLDEAADRNWEISEAQERAKSFFEAQDDVIVRRDSDGAITYVNDAFCALAGRTRDDLLATAFALPVDGAGRNHVARRRHARLRPEDRRARRRALDRLARGHGAHRQRQRDAKRRPRRHRPRAGRAGAGRGARSGGNGEPRQVAVPGHGVARNPHAAERHSRHGRSASATRRSRPSRRRI